MVAVIVLVAVFVLATEIIRGWGNWLPDPLVSSEPIQNALKKSQENTLFVIVPGLAADPTVIDGVAQSVRPYGDVMVIHYPSSAASNADAEAISTGISKAIEAAFAGGKYHCVILVGYSMGALLARKALLIGAGAVGDVDGNAAPAAWARYTKRVVLLAGTNRGWDFRSKPMDMGWLRYLKFRCAIWYAETTGVGRLVMQCRQGAPFVANLRLEWMRWFRSMEKEQLPFVVQLLGDIDDVVSDQDNKDLRSVGGTDKMYSFIRVRGSGHESVIRFHDSETISEKDSEGICDDNTLGNYRRRKFVHAATALPADLMKENEERFLTVDEDVKHLVFVLHGIRDFGRWSAGFETALKKKGLASTAHRSEKIAVSSIRYGYFGMGPFLLRTDRQKYVRWFMDEYTETIAHYPNLKDNDFPNFKDNVDFVGHSHGTYLLSSALSQYRSLRVKRVVFGGSVVRQDYDWGPLLKRRQVEAVRNYVAYDDWVVALLPRVFEYRLMNLVNDDLGSAGYFGFTRHDHDGNSSVENIRFISGHHGAFLHHVNAIADFLIDGKPDGHISNSESHYVGEKQQPWALLKFLSMYCGPLIWGLTLCIVVWIALILQRFGIPVLACYFALVWWFLNWF